MMDNIVRTGISRMGSFCLKGLVDHVSLVHLHTLCKIILRSNGNDHLRLLTHTRGFTQRNKQCIRSTISTSQRDAMYSKKGTLSAPFHLPNHITKNVQSASICLIFVQSAMNCHFRGAFNVSV